MLKTINKIEVLKKDFHKADYNDIHNCPVANALQRLLNRKDISVGGSQFVLYRNPIFKYVCFKDGYSYTQYIEDYYFIKGNSNLDGDYVVRTINFEEEITIEDNGKENNSKEQREIQREIPTEAY